MADPAVVTSPAAAGAPPAGSTPPVTTTPATTTPKPATTDPGAKSGTDAPVNPTKFKFKFDEGESEVEADFTDAVTPPEPTDTQFKFESLDAIKESHADLYKSIKSELSKAGRYAKYGYKTPEDVKAVNDRISTVEKSLGRQDGKVGLDAIEATLGDLANVVVGLQSGDKEVYSKAWKDNPQGMAQAASEMNSQWHALDPKAHDAYVAAGALAAFTAKDAAGVSAIDALNQLFSLDSVKGDPKAQDLLKRAAHTLNSLNEAGNYKPDQAPLLAKQEAEIKAGQQKLWNDRTDFEVQPIVSTALRRGLSSLTSELKRELTADERSEYMEFLDQKFYEHAKKDGEFTRRAKEMYDKQDREGIKTLTKQNRQKFATAALKDLFREKLLNREAIRSEASSKAEVGGGGSASGTGNAATQYTGKMRHGAPAVDYDYDRMRSEDPEMLYSHFFYIKGKREKYTW